MLRLPTVFVWGERDRLVSYRFARHVRDAAPSAGHAVLRCCGHAPYGIHGACFAHAVDAALEALETAQAFEAGSPDRRTRASIEAPCLVIR
jgi:pimeloyl-ACP methyl ester carboxylesterase